MKKILNPPARNFVSLLLHVDPLKRLSIPRALQHPFITGRDAARLPGDQADFDVFISYRVASDANHAAILYELLTAKGLKVWWDQVCLEAGVPWDEGFCHGLIKSHAFVPLLSRQAINHPDIIHQNFEKLTTDSRCDNVYLEYRLALELREMGLVEKIFPVMIGDLEQPALEQEHTPNMGTDDEAHEKILSCSGEYSHYFSSGCHPNKASTATVATVETALRTHLDNEGLGSPYTTSESPHSVLSQITQNQGAFLTGNMSDSFSAIVGTIVGMIQPSEISNEEVSTAGLELNQNKELLAEDNNASFVDNKAVMSGMGGAVAVLKARIESLTEENLHLKLERERMDSKRQDSEAQKTKAIKDLQEENRRLKLSCVKSAENTSADKKKQGGSDHGQQKIQRMPLAFLEELTKFDKGLAILSTPDVLQCDSDEIKKLTASKQKV